MSTCVIVPALHPQGTRRLVELLHHTCDSVIVVDNAGGVVARALGDTDPWVTVLVPERNIGFGAAVHLAATRAEEEFLVILNDDVVPRPDFVRRITAPFADPAVHQVSALVLVAGDDRIDTVGLAFDRTLRADDVREMVGSRPKYEVLGPSGAAAAYRRASYLALGGYTAELFAYWEDSDLALRFWAAGHRCVFAADAIAEHERGVALGGRSARQREFDAFGRGFVLARYGDWMSASDRLVVPLVDWPSILTGCALTRSLRPLRARLAGAAAGRQCRINVPRGRSGSAASRPVRETLAVQVRGIASAQLRVRARLRSRRLGGSRSIGESNGDRVGH